MPWTRPTLAELEERVEGDITSRLTGSAPLMRKAVLKIIAKALAVLAHILHGFLAYLGVNMLPDQAEGEWLERIAWARGLHPIRLPASSASGSITLGGANGTTVPSGTGFIADSGLEFATTAPGTISSGAAIVPVICRTPGADGNLPLAAVLSIQTPISGVNVTGTAAAAFSGGADKESDAALRDRLRAFIQSPPSGGSKADYIRWARTVPGVRQAWCFPNYYGRGTIAVVISAMGVDPEPDAPLVAAVQAYLDRDDVRPVPADVRVFGIVPRVVDVQVFITPYNAGLAAAIQASVADMFAKEAAPGGTLYMTQLQRAIHVAGIRNYQIESLSVGGNLQPIVDYQFTGFEYMVLGNVNVSEQP